MILRVEDTDAERNKPELVNGILDGLQMVGCRLGRRPVLPVAADRLVPGSREKVSGQRHARFSATAPAEKYVGGDHAEEGAEANQSSPRLALFLPRRPASRHPV